MTASAELRDILVVLLAAVLIVPIFRRFGASAVLGYLVVGTVIGPSGLDLVTTPGTTSALAQLGVVFLLFSVGLELSLRRLSVLRRYVFGLGVAQVAVTTLALWAALRVLGLASAPALVLGSGLALSSTAVVLQMLTEQRELPTPQGQVALALLLLQDLAVVPLLTLLPLLGRPSAAVPTALGAALVRAVMTLVAIVAIGRLALRPLLRGVAKSRNPELFTGITLLLILGLGWITESAGVSLALGAFLAGLLIAETEYRPQVEGDIQPFRGLLLAFFFVTVGMGLDLARIPAQLPLILGLLGALLLIKSVILAVLARAFGLSSKLAGAVGLTLAQGSEFGFVLFALAAGRGIVAAETAQLAMLVIGLSMAVTPLLMAASRVLLRRPSPPINDDPALTDAARELSDHVLIAGFGRVGQTLALLLEAPRETPHGSYLALDLDPERVAEARRHRFPAHFGDASRAEVLRAAGVERARLLVVTLDQPNAAHRTVQAARRLRPDLPILVRARDVPQCERLAAAGATLAVPEIVEGSLQLGGALLRALGDTRDEVEQVLEGFRRQTYARLTPLNGER